MLLGGVGLAPSWRCRPVTMVASTVHASVDGHAESHMKSLLLDSTWRLMLDVGREDDTRMPEDWAMSGARMRLSLDARFQDLAGVPADREPIISPFNRDGAQMLLLPLEGNARFVGMNGLEHVPVEAGQADLTPVPSAMAKQSLRFWLDVEAGASHRDVSLPPACRLFFFMDAWEPDLLDRATAKFQALEQKVTALQTRADRLRADATTSPAHLFRSGYEWSTMGEELLNSRLELKRCRDEMPEEQGTEAGHSLLTVARQGVVSIRRKRPAQFGFLPVELPIPRVVYEPIGTFSMRPL